MSYSVDCQCGNVLTVEAVDAGGFVNCCCGATVAVPALSMLRLRAGQSSYPVRIADKLLAMSEAGELPIEQTCLECGIGTSNILNCKLVCETAYVKKHTIWMILGWICLSP
jgi:hypothetical protein